MLENLYELQRKQVAAKEEKATVTVEELRRAPVESGEEDENENN